MFSLRISAVAVAALASFLVASTAFAAEITGPSSSASPYLVRSAPGVVIKSILTVGDSVNAKPDGTPYRLAGLPDGLGAFNNGDGTFTLLVNHEIREGQGAVRAHGARGAFVSRWIIATDTLQVLYGEDLIQTVATWNSVSGAHNAPATGVSIGRLCSADLPAASAFYNSATGRGYNDRIYLNGEETGNEGRAFGHTMSGTSYELPRLGKYSWENAVANPSTGDQTVVIGLDDSTPGQVYVYVGTKTASGSPVEQAGLTNGRLYGIKVAGVPTEGVASGIPSGTPFTLVDFGNVENTTGAALESSSNAAAVTRFNRPEDGAWDPRNRNHFYFVTTASFSTFSRLYRLNFADIDNPAAGGTIDQLLTGGEGPKMMDNLTVNGRGQVLIQEDPGNQPHLAKVWRYDIDSDRNALVAQHDPSRFAPGAPEFLTQDEESSGIISAADILGEGWYLLDVQAHYATDSELVEGGQILTLHIPPGRR